MLRDYEQKKELKFKLNVAECINFAYTGSQPIVKGNRNHIKAYENWKKKILEKIYPGYYTKQNVWDTLKELRNGRKKIEIG